MKVSRVDQILQVEIIPVQFGNRARISEDIAPAVVLQDDGQSGLGRTGNLPQARDIHATFDQARQRHGSQLIVADARLEAHAAAQRGEVVNKNAGRGAECEHHVVGQQFALGRKLLGKSVKNEIEVQLSGNRNIKTWHVNFFLLTLMDVYVKIVIPKRPLWPEE